MKKHISSLIIILISFQVNGQMTTEEGLEIAEQLFEVEMLTEKGRNQLIAEIQDDNFFRPKRNFINSHSNSDLFSEKGEVLMRQGLTKSRILDFLRQAFTNDFYYRTGISQQLKLLQSNDDDSTELNDGFDELAGLKIEENIIAEDSSSTENDQGWIMYPGGFGMDAEDYNLIHEKRSVLGKTRTGTVTDLYRIGLIDKKLHDKAIALIQSNGLIFEQYVLLFLTEETIFYEDFKENKQQQVEYLKKLNHANIISDDNFKKIMASYGDHELKSRASILNYCNRGLTLQVNSYSTNPEFAYQAIFEEIKKILPSFQYDSLKIDTYLENTEEWDDDLKQYVIIEFQVNEIQYKNTFFQNHVPKDKTKPIRNFTISFSFYKSINQFLKDTNSSSRLYHIENKANNEFGLILLTAKEFEDFRMSKHDYSLYKKEY